MRKTAGADRRDQHSRCTAHLSGRGGSTWLAIRASPVMGLHEQLAATNFMRRKKSILLHLSVYISVTIQIRTMKKYMFILMSAALLLACEQKTETTEPAATPAATSPPATTQTYSPAAITESPAAITESPAATTESPPPS